MKTNPEDAKQWLGADRCAKLDEQTEYRLEAILNRVCQTAPDPATAALWTLQHCGSQPTPDDTARWRNDTTPAREAAKKPARRTK